MKQSLVVDAQVGALLTLRDLSAATGVSERRLRHYIEVGAVSPATGRTRAARYEARHIQEVVAVLKALKEGTPIIGMATREDQRRRAAAAGLASDWPAVRKPVIYQLTEHLALVAEGALDPREKRLLNALKATARDFLTKKHGEAHGVHASSKT